MEDKHDTVNNSVFYEFSSEAKKYLFDPNQKSCLLRTWFCSIKLAFQVD